MVQTHFPSTGGHTILWLSTLHLLQVASLLSSCFFLSCFPCLTLATSTASSAWQQLEESTRIFKSSPVILQLQLPDSSLEVQAWSWLAPGVYSPGVYHVLKWEFVEMDKLCRWTGSWKQAILPTLSLGTNLTIKAEMQRDWKSPILKFFFTYRNSLLKFSGLHDLAHFEQPPQLK